MDHNSSDEEGAFLSFNPADQEESVVAAILKREELGSTGIGNGVAVPHTKHPSVEKLVGTVAVSVEGVDFKSLDGEKVQLFFLWDDFKTKEIY